MDDWIIQQQQQDLIRQQQIQQDLFQQQLVQQNLAQQLVQQPDPLGQQRVQEDLARQQLERQRANEEIRIGEKVASYNPAYQSSPFDVSGSENRPQEELERQNQRIQAELFNQRQAQDLMVPQQDLFRQQQQAQGDSIRQQQIQDELTRQQQQEDVVRQQQTQNYPLSQQQAQDDFIRQQQGQDEPIRQQRQQDFIRQQQQAQEDLIRQQGDPLGQQRAQEDLARQQLESERANEDARISGLVSNFNPGYKSSPFDVDGSVNRPQEQQEIYNQQLQNRFFDQRQVHDEVEEAFKNARAEGALLELQEHGAARAIRGDAGVSGRDVQSMHLAPQAAMKDVPGYDPREALTAFGGRDDHSSIDAHWKADFHRRANEGQTTITAKDLFATVSDSIRQGNFSDAEKQSLILRLQDELFVDRGLAPNSRLRLPYS